MARIRTIKPSFYRHEELIELETKHCDLKVMLVFSALWGHCDKNGVFEWKPRYLQLDILPFYWEATGKQLVASLMLLRENGFVQTLSDGIKVYGFIPTFKEHQRISGRESTDDATYPNNTDMDVYHLPGEATGIALEATGKQQGSGVEAVVNTGREGKGREKEEEGNEISATAKPSRPTRKPALSDDEWMQEMKNNSAYAGIDIDRLKGRLEAWCLTKGLKPTRARLLNWLNREEKPMAPSVAVTSDTPDWMKGMH